MFEISWSELLILAVVTLLFVGPKELPVFLRTIGRYAGMARRQASEFRAQFDAAMREAEFDAMKKEMEQMQASVDAEVKAAEKSFKEAEQVSKFDPTSITTPVVSEPPAQLAMADPASVEADVAPPLPAPPAAFATTESR